MNKCNKCLICKYTDFEYSPKGTDTPEIYFVSEAMSSEDNENHDIFTSSGHQLLISMLDAFGINFNNSRFAHIVRCYPQTSDSDTNYRKPSQEEVDNCKQYLFEDILKTKPKLIVTLGGLVSKEFVGDEFTTITKCHGNLYHKPVNGVEFDIMPMYHPSYVERRASDTKVRFDYKSDIQKILQICSGSYSEYTNYDDKEDYQDETIICRNYAEFDKFCKDEIDNAEIVAYDIETNAEEKSSSRYEVVGFSLASRRVVGCYVTNDSLDYSMSVKDKKMIEARLRKILISKRILTYNSMHELLATLNWLNIEIPKIDDLFVMVKLLMGNAGKYEGNGGLKIQCEMNLNCKDWSEDLDTYFDYLRDFKNKRSQMIVLLSKYYTREELPHIIDLVNKCYEDHNGKFNKVISYGLVPYKLIGKYGGIDSSILFDLKEFYQKEIEKYNKELGIDLNKGYQYWMKHHIAGYTLEKNGAFWNDDVATEIEDWCNKGLRESLTELIKSPLSEPVIRSKVEYNFQMFLKDNFLMRILGNMATPKRKYKGSVHIVLNDSIQNNRLKERLSKMSVVPNDKGIIKLELGHIESLYDYFFDDMNELFDKFYKSYMNKFLSVERTDDELKGLLNPRSTIASFKDFISGILITPKVIYAKFYDNMLKYIESPKFSLDDYDGPRYSVDKKLLELMIKLKEDEEMSQPRKLELFIKFIDNCNHFASYNIKNRLQSAMEYHLDSLDDDHIIELYNLYEMCGLDIEDRDSWSEEFKWLYNFRCYKKYAKILTTYINAKVGRNNVWYVDKESYSRGDYFTRRDIQYNEVRDGKYSLDDVKDKIPIYQPSFFVDFADTGRWTCFTGDTKIKCLDGNSYSFDELVKNNVKELWVYSRDKDNNVTPALAVNPHIAKQVTSICSITLDSGDIIRCTPDHKFMLKDGSYKEAQNLTKYDSLMPLSENCMIKSIEIVNCDPINVYDISVPGTNNFALDCGVFVHNCGFHTIPAGKSIKRIYTSRFDGGMIAMPDCSQAEVRVLAAVSGDENLLNAFQQQGMDIHKFVASRVFHDGDMSLVTSRERKVAKGAVFGLLYGESEKSFADSFFHGDISEAKKVYDYFYTSFPKIKDYVEDSHNMFKQTGKISLKMFNRFINLEPQVLLNGGDKDRVLRQSQNFIIQGQTCDLAGMILYNICEFVKKNNLKSKPFCFIHDSIEIDIANEELFYVLDNLGYLFNEYPMKTFGVPMASDVVFSTNMGAEIEVVELIHDDEYNEVTIKLDGFVDDMDEVENTWNRVYDVCEKLEEELGEKQYVPYKGLFQKKVVVSPDFGSYRQTCSRTYHVIRKRV